MTEKIKAIINKAGIMDVGFCKFKRVEDDLLECRAEARIPKGAKTVIVCLFPYKVKENAPENISRYAAVPDYHKVCGEYLKSACEELKIQIDGYQFESFIDNSPLPEVHTAAAAGLGIIGKNGLLINQKYGSFVFIGEIVTDLELEFNDVTVKRCPDCGLCKAVCPKHNYDCECLSKVSQKKGELKADEAALLKKHGIVWGCDICAEVCPLNKNAKTTYIKEFIDGYKNNFSIGEYITGRAYEWRGEKTVVRNAVLQIGD